jgi:uncharacterized protein YdiU (UPF0061 family)
METKKLQLENTYITLPEKLYSKVNPTKIIQPELVVWNEGFASQLGLSDEHWKAEDKVKVFSGNTMPSGATPIAQAYAGHQFGHFTMLGDGRAHLLGELIDPNGSRFDIQLKGSGITPYSRRGDGRATLKSMLREYLISEAMHGLKIPTSRSLAVVKSSEKIWREKQETMAVLTRVASSHLRVGTFEYAKRFAGLEVLEELTKYTLNRHFPNLPDNKFIGHTLLEAVMDKQLDLVVNWWRVGFIHGVMNTDNTGIAGETFDYGPCAFMNAYHPETVYSSIDHGGRYAFENQPGIIQWNLSVLAGALLPLIDNEQEKAIEKAQRLLQSFPQLFEIKWRKMMCEKIGITYKDEKDQALIKELLTWMQEKRADFTNTFAYLTYGEAYDASLFHQEDFQNWKQKLEKRKQQEHNALELANKMKQSNPCFIPRNHLVEQSLEQMENGNNRFWNTWIKALQDPYNIKNFNSEIVQPPENGDYGYQTFCGT